MQFAGIKRYLPMGFMVVVSGALLTLSFPPFTYYPLVWIALVPLFLVLEKEVSYRKSFIIGFSFGLVHVSTTMYWIYVSVHRYGGLPAWGAAALTLSLIFYLSIYWGLTGLIFTFLKKVKLLWFFLFFAVLIEYVRGYPLIRFPWGGLEMALPPHLALAQIVDLFGIYGLGFIIWGINFLIYMAVRDFRESRTGLIAREVLLIVLIFVGCQSYGNMRISEMRQEVRRWRKARVCVIQPDIEQSLKWRPAWKVKGLERFLEMSRRAAAGFHPRLMIWPEAAVTFYIKEKRDLTERIVNLVRQGHYDLVFGATSFDLKVGETVYHNSAYLMSSEGKILGRYDKTRLVPFGEYVPLRHFFPFIKNIVGAEEDFTPGKTLKPLRSNLGPLGTTICFEGIFPEISGELVRKGALLLVNLTNDGWFGRSSGPYQHLRLTAYRAVEDRIYLVRSTGTGISVIVSPVGEILVRMPLESEGFMRAIVRLREGSLTVYAKYGDIFVIFCAMIALLAVGWGLFLRIKGERR
jgi:apolipoprotein N-acyltransferase